MTTQTQTQRTALLDTFNQASHAEALDAYVARIAEIQTKLARLVEFANNHGDVDPDDVTWANVGTLGYVNEQLDEISGFLFGNE